eukprot:19183-Heterococcus_DN1.PRE.2
MKFAKQLVQCSSCDMNILSLTQVARSKCTVSTWTAVAEKRISTQSEVSEYSSECATCRHTLSCCCT